MKEYIASLFMACIAVLAPLQSAMITVGVLIFIDLVLGLIAAKKQQIKIESRKLKFTAVKMLVYQLLIISAFIAEKYLIDWLPLNKITMAFIAVVEFTSIGENFQKITGLPFYQFIKDWLNQKLNKVKE
ncbi:MAG: phage holin family protein [Candidatus Paceibacterota bacterium]